MAIVVIIDVDIIVIILDPDLDPVLVPDLDPQEDPEGAMDILYTIFIIIIFHQINLNDDNKESKQLG